MPRVTEYGYEYDAVLDEALLARTRGQCAPLQQNGWYLLRSGRDALKAVAREYTPRTVLMPSLACDSMVQPFEQHGHRVVYYRLDARYRADFADLHAQLRAVDGKAIVLYMAYFGNPSLTDEQLSLLKENFPALVFAEDCTHDLLYVGKRAFLPQYTVASVRKWLNVPDGGVLFAHRSLQNTAFVADTAFSEARREAQCMRHAYFMSGDEQLKTAYRQIFTHVTDRIDGETVPARMSAYAFAMLEDTDWQAIRRRREENAAVLSGVFSSGTAIKQIQPAPCASNLYVPILLEARDAVQRRLAQQGIFTTLIWPLNDRQIQRCPVAAYTQAHMLGVPCDQRYTAADMTYIGKALVHAVENS